MSTTDNVAKESVLGQLRELREQLQQERHLDLNVPGYSGVLRARYSPLSYERLRSIGDKARKASTTEAGRELVLAAESLVAACEGMYFRKEDGSYEPLVNDTGKVVKYDKDLANALGVENPAGDGEIEPRMVVYEVFGGLHNGADLRVITHFQQFGAWQGTGDEEVDEQLVGESNGAG
jgi:hypothetical protein